MNSINDEGKKTIFEKIMFKVKQSNFIIFCATLKEPIYEDNLKSLKFRIF